MATTTIQIDVQIRDQLRARGRMGETYNDVIRRLLAATRSLDSMRSPFMAASTPVAAGPRTPLKDRD
jgi:hypothetical protein